eukprot:GEMP01061154.1.p1 GENE.GEMP01061154.1~~GEMP01061154.1.p1  ORF type:complete len:312 (+),score=61.83 GEMP01061154.1:77-1012(+)
MVSISERFDQGNDAAEAGHYPGALRLFSEVIDSESATDDQRGRAWECKAQVCLMMEDAYEACHCAKHAMSALPLWGPAVATYAHTLLELGRKDEACEAYRRALSLLVPVEDIIPGLIESKWDDVASGGVESDLHLGPGARIWPCGRLLGAFLLGLPLASHERVLELGCGASGIVGRCCLQSGVGNVLFTDIQDVVDEMVRCSPNALHIQVFDWRDEDACARIIEDFRPTVVVGADLVYTEHIIVPLIARLKDLASSGTDILLSHQSRWSNVDEKLTDEIRLHGLVKDSIMVTKPRGRFARNCELFRLTNAT